MSVLSLPLEAGEMAIYRSSRMTCILIPFTAVLSRPSEVEEMAITSSNTTRILIPVASVLSRPSEAKEMAITSAAT